jgi:hypothetical protein
MRSGRSRTGPTIKTITFREEREKEKERTEGYRQILNRKDVQMHQIWPKTPKYI